jgi:hypothetical protein
VTVAELITQLQVMPQDAVAVDEDELEVITVTASPDLAIATIWTEQK